MKQKLNGHTSSGASCIASATPLCHAVLCLRLQVLLNCINGTLVCSLGEQQRVAFARLLLHRPGLSFLDEATSAVDSETEAVLYRALQSQSKSFVSVGERTRLGQSVRIKQCWSPDMVGLGVQASNIFWVLLQGIGRNCVLTTRMCWSIEEAGSGDYKRCRSI